MQSGRNGLIIITDTCHKGARYERDEDHRLGGHEELPEGGQLLGHGGRAEVKLGLQNVLGVPEEQAVQDGGGGEVGGQAVLGHAGHVARPLHKEGRIGEILFLA